MVLTEDEKAELNAACEAHFIGWQFDDIDKSTFEAGFIVGYKMGLKYIKNENVATPAEIQEKIYPGFIIRCAKCKSKRVIFDSSLGYSAESGGWGSIDLVCLDCDNRIEIFENY